MTRALISVPAKARRGQIITIKTLISHKMETGFRFTTTGERLPRDIIHTLLVTYNGEEILRAELHPAVSANPFLTFTTVATVSGTIVFRWMGDNGFTATKQATITVA